jgi:hypothetical protein
MMIVYILIGLIVDIYLFFIIYVASMNMIRAHKENKLNGYLWALCLPFVGFAWLYDLLHNMIHASLIFIELPKQLLVTDRIKQHINDSDYRGELSRFLCEKILSPFDYSGNHCD